MSNIITVEDLNLWYGSTQALHHVSMEIPEKSITALIGPSLSAQHLQHSSGIFSVTRLPENDSLSFQIILFASCWRNHNRICCKNQSF